MDYNRLIALFIDGRRSAKTLPSTIRKDTKTLEQSIDFLGKGNFDAPNEEYFSALEAHFLESLAKSTTDSRISLTRKFFAWIQKGEAIMQEEKQITITDNLEGGSNEEVNIKEEASEATFDHDNDGIQEAEKIEQKAPSLSGTEKEQDPPSSFVKATPPLTPHEGASTQDEHKISKQIKITVYPDHSLEKDIRDLAALDGMPVSKFILRLIQQEVYNRKEDLAVLHSLRAKRIQS